MDAERELKADQALRDLFREAGHQEAPLGIDARILQRIPSIAPGTTKQERSLIPSFVWVAAGAGVAGSIAWLLANTGSTDGGSYLDGLVSSLPRISISGALSSPWAMMTCASIVALLALDTLLARRTTTLLFKGWS